MEYQAVKNILINELLFDDIIAAHAGLIVKGGRAEGHLIEVAVSEQSRPEKVWKDQLGHLC